MSPKLHETIISLNSLGFTVHPDKSVLNPTQEISFLGFLLNSQKMTVSLTPEKKQEIKMICELFIKRRECHIREFAKIIGKLVASEPGVQFAPLYIKNLEITKDDLLKQNHGNFDAKMTITMKMKNTLNWWVNNIQDSYKPVRQADPSVTLQTDSSGLGWGCVMLTTKHQTGGHWSYVEQKCHINFLELKAASLGLKSFCALMTNTHIRIQMDNMVAVSYINNMGGRKMELNDLGMVYQT